MTSRSLSLLSLTALIAAPMAPVLAQPVQPSTSAARPVNGQPAANASGASAADASAASYVLGPDDEIEVTIFGMPDLTTKTRIRSDGTIILPFINSVQAAGKTTAELSAFVATAYKREGMFAVPSINVEVTNYASKTVTVLGAVPNAGLYAIDRPYTVAAIIAKAGGVRQDGANAVILTPAGGGAPVRLSLMDTSGASGRMIAPGDSLFVPPAEQVYVYGPVNEPGAFPYVPGMTFRQALGKAGGPTVAGSSRKIEVRRDGKKVKADIDDPILPEDVLIIKEKFF